MDFFYQAILIYVFGNCIYFYILCTVYFYQSTKQCNFAKLIYVNLINLYISVCVCVYVCVHIYLYIYIYICVCVCVCVCVGMCVCVHVLSTMSDHNYRMAIIFTIALHAISCIFSVLIIFELYIYIYTHTNIHTHTHLYMYV